MKTSVYKFIFWAWYGLVFLSSFFSNGWITKINDPTNHIRSDYFLHFIVFFAFPLIGMYLTKEEKSNRQFYILMSVCVVLAFVSEIVQKFVPHRSFNPNDMLANIVGIAVGIALISLINTTRKNITKSN